MITVRNHLYPKSRRSCVTAFVAVVLAIVSTAPALAFSGARCCFSDSIKEIASDPNVQVIRQTLIASEHNEVLRFSVSLKMPNFAELEDRIAHGEQIPHAVMEARYLPSESDYTAVEAWLIGQGFTLRQEDPNHTNIFLSGTVSQIENTLGVSFARVATAEGEFTSAISAPNLPAEFSNAVLGINGLQPHLRMHPRSRFQPNFTSIGGQEFFAPADILAAYNAPSTLNGTKQTIAVVMDAMVATSDLRTFYSTIGSTATTANFTTIKVDGGPTSPSQNEVREAALDVEWTSGTAPGAQIRLYAIPDLSNLSIHDASVQILADAQANNITVVSISLGGAESDFSPSTMQTDSQDFAQMAAAGITVLFASGDGGSNPGGSDGSYNVANPREAEYPASDPNVAGVGGTELFLNQNTLSYAGETVFSTISGGSGFASGGGVSQLFARPTWQTDGGSILNTNPFRCVPDVSIVWDSLFQSSNFGSSALVVVNGGDIGGGGTSLSVQVWGGIAALLNQARATAGKPTLGLLGPAIYPLHGTSAFNDITSGNNGFYSAGPGYDLCTGLGSPNITNLANALGTVPTAPTPSSPASGSGGGSSGGGGGGGALSYWFYLALAMLLAIRLGARRASSTGA